MPYAVLISKRPEDEAFAQDVAGSVGLKLVACKSAQMGVSCLDSLDQVGAVFVDASSDRLFADFERELFRHPKLTFAKAQAPLFHYISDLSLEDLPLLSRSPFFGSLLSRAEGTDRFNLASRYSRLVRAATAREVPGVAKLLDRDARVQKLILKSSADGAKMALEVANVGRTLGLPERVARKIELAAEEILLNAIYNAPVDAEGNRPRAKMDRSQAFALDEKHQIEFEVGYDANRMGFRITDSFGSFERGKFLQHITRGTAEEGKILDTEKTGAGLGLAAVYATGASLFVRCEAGKQTDFTVIFPKVKSVRDLKTQFRSTTALFY